SNYVYYNRTSTGTFITGGSWANPSNGLTPQSSYFTPTSSNVGLTTGQCTMNCTNEYNIYSFHDGGSSMLAADGSVHFVSDHIVWQELAALFTRAYGEVLSGTDF